MADDVKANADAGVFISLKLDEALKAYREMFGPERYLARIEHALTLAKLGDGYTTQEARRG